MARRLVRLALVAALGVALALGAYSNPPAWTPLPPPPLPVHGAHGAVVNGRFLIAGGASRQGQFSRFAWSGLLQAYTPGPD